MKELTIEQKAQRFDEALGKARRYYDEYKTRDNILYVEDMEDMFPELKESEDERIRKVLINMFKGYDIQKVGDFTDKEIIAWLEKQGEQKPSISDEALREGIIKFGITQYQIDNWLKKHINVVEQKPTGKVELKFHEGDWIIHQGTENIYQVVAVIDNQYQLKYGDNYTVQKCADVDRCARLYDVTKDAKDGDVLVSKSPCGLGTWYCIFKSLDNDESMTVYCYLARNGRFETKKELCFDKDPYNTIPATKEQRDTLLKAMTDAGYTFDFEKKELKKIEQNHAEEYNITGIGSKNAQGKLGEMIKNLKPINEVLEQKLAWSEEDEKMLDFAIRAVGLCKQYAINHQVNGYSKLPDVPKRYEELQDWLKSIKERIGCEVNCTTTNKWSEEDEKILKTITSDVLRMRQKCGIGTDEWNIRSNALNWLKYHLSQRRWKPTEKQLMELKCAIRGCSFNIEQLVSLEEQLEQL